MVKTMGSFILLAIVLVFAFAFIGMVPALAQTGAASPPVQPGILDWIQNNLTYVLGLLLAVSELLAVTPWFKGNGILDILIKAIKYFMNKGQPSDDKETSGDDS